MKFLLINKKIWFVILFSFVAISAMVYFLLTYEVENFVILNSQIQKDSSIKALINADHVHKLKKNQEIIFSILDETFRTKIQVIEKTTNDKYLVIFDPLFKNDLLVNNSKINIRVILDYQQLHKLIFDFF